MFMPTTDAFTQAEKIEIASALGTGPAHGLMAGAQVETADGWRAVETLRAGQAVHTLDGGLRRIRSLTRGHLPGGFTGRGPALVRLPGGVLGAEWDLFVSPGTPILVEHRIVEDVLGRPSVLVRAEDICGFSGVGRVRMVTGAEVIQLSFDEEEIVYTNGGALIHCAGPVADSFFPVIGAEQARALTGLLADAVRWSDELVLAA